MLWVKIIDQITDFQTVVSRPNIVLNLNFKKLTLMTGFVVQGHV